MSSYAPTDTSPSRSLGAILRDVASLTKPRITLMVLVTAAGGMWLAPGTLSTGVLLAMLLTTTTVVMAANSLNCWLERDSDRFMRRTAKRPLPDGRLEPRIALALGVGLGLVSVPVLTFVVNPLTGLLGALALVSYVAVYTPMKRSSSAALLVGSVPGALPPLMGWTAVTGTLDAPGLVLFAILFLWQVPHFLAISVFRQRDYERAGLKTLASERGVPVAMAQSVFYTAMLLAASTLLYVFRVAGPVYLLSALALGAAFFAVTVAAMRAGKDTLRWARRSFLASLLYLTLLFAALMIDALWP